MSKFNSEIVDYFVAGGFGGMCCIATGHPFDTIKVRIQTMPKPAIGMKPVYDGAYGCLKQTIQKEGFFALYKGMMAPLIGVSPLFATYFGGCALGKWIQQKSPEQELSNFQNFSAGALAGVFTTVIMVPGERIKCLLQVQHSGNAPKDTIHFSGPLDVVKRLHRDGGISSIYRGTAATLLRDIPASGMYFMTYEYLKKLFLRGKSEKSLSPAATLAAGGFAGIANWLVCLPADVLKSRLQAAPEGKYPDGIRGVFREVIREDGPKALFKGFVPVMLRAFPANAACFFGFELALKFLRFLQKQV